MKRLVLLFVVLFSLSAYAMEKTGKLEIGDKAMHTDVKMLDVSGDKVSLDDVKMENGVLVVFSSNTCPFVKKWEPRYNDLKEYAESNNVGMVVLNSNCQKRDGDDSYNAMQEKAEKMGYDFHYVVDKGSKLANSFGGQTTPHAFLFNNDYELVYKGAIDDNYDSADEVKKAYVKEAVKNIANGEDVAIAETKPVGCSIKRKLD